MPLSFAFSKIKFSRNKRARHNVTKQYCSPANSQFYIVLDARKLVMGGLRTTSAQSDQRLCFSLIGKYNI